MAATTWKEINQMMADARALKLENEILKARIDKLEKLLKDAVQNDCNHTYQNGCSAVSYSDKYEMKTSDMYCDICDKKGTRRELEADIDSLNIKLKGSGE